MSSEGTHTDLNGNCQTFVDREEREGSWILPSQLCWLYKVNRVETTTNLIFALDSLPIFHIHTSFIDNASLFLTTLLLSGISFSVHYCTASWHVLFLLFNLLVHKAMACKMSSLSSEMTRNLTYSSSSYSARSQNSFWCLTSVSKEEGMTICVPMDVILATTSLSLAVEKVSASKLNILVIISLCNGRTEMHIYWVFWWSFLRQL